MNEPSLDSSNSMHLKVNVKKERAKSLYDITITILNESHIGIRSATVTVKDAESNSGQIAYFGRIEPGTSDVRVVALPGGVDFTHAIMQLDVGEPAIAVGAANNVTRVNIHLTD